MGNKSRDSADSQQTPALSDNACERAWHEHSVALAAQALRWGVGPHEADDMVQKVFLRLQRQWPLLEPNQLGRWLRQMLKYELIRKSKWSVEEPVAEPVAVSGTHLRARDPLSPWPDAEHDESTKDVVRQIEQWMAKLDPVSRDLFRCSYVLQMSAREAVEHLRIRHRVTLTEASYSGRKRRLRIRLITHLRRGNI